MSYNRYNQTMLRYIRTIVLVLSLPNQESLQIPIENLKPTSSIESWMRSVTSEYLIYMFALCAKSPHAAMLSSYCEPWRMMLLIAVQKTELWLGSPLAELVCMPDILVSRLYTWQVIFLENVDCAFWHDALILMAGGIKT